MAPLFGDLVALADRVALVHLLSVIVTMIEMMMLEEEEEEEDNTSLGTCLHDCLGTCEQCFLYPDPEQCSS